MLRFMTATTVLGCVVAIGYAGDGLDSNRATVNARLSTGETLEVQIVRTTADRGTPRSQQAYEMAETSDQDSLANPKTRTKTHLLATTAA